MPTPEACPRFFFHQGWGKGAEIFWSGAEPRTKIVLPLEHDRQERGGGAEYLIINKERIVLASANFAPHERFFHQGQKHTTINFIRAYLDGTYVCTLWFQSSGAYVPYAPRLDTPLESLLSYCIYFKIVFQILTKGKIWTTFLNKFHARLYVKW